jgi:hypothetical protein
VHTEFEAIKAGVCILPFLYQVNSEHHFYAKVVHIALNCLKPVSWCDCHLIVTNMTKISTLVSLSSSFAMQLFRILNRVSCCYDLPETVPNHAIG